MGSDRKRAKHVPVENLGIDPQSLTTEEIEEILENLEKTVLKHLRTESARREDFIVTASIDVLDEEVVCTIDVEIQTAEPVTPEYEARIDEAINKALEVVSLELKKKARKN